MGAAHRYRRRRHAGAEGVDVHRQEAATSISKFFDDYTGSSGVQTPTGGFENADVVFIGYGIEAPEYKWDDFKGVDVKGKVVVMLNNDPDWDPKLFAGNTRLYYGRWVYKYESAARHGAAGVIIVHTIAVGGVSVAGGDVVLVRRAVRPAGGRRAARAVPRLGHRRGDAPARESRRTGSGQADRCRAQPQLQARAARPEDHVQIREQGVAREDRERGRPAAGERSAARRARW